MKKYIFKPYSTIFPKLFEKEKQRISSHIKKDVDIEHVGSTAVPGLGGKGIIDIAIETSKERLDSVSGMLKQLGYEFRPTGGTADRLFFKIDLPLQEGMQTYHIHLTYPESKIRKDMIAFRDYLKSHPEEAEKYAEFKRKAANEANEDGIKYMKLKEPVINEILAKIL